MLHGRYNVNFLIKHLTKESCNSIDFCDTTPDDANESINERKHQVSVRLYTIQEYASLKIFNCFPSYSAARQLDSLL